jgi:two-component system cell cycle sensor histidine kinase/response regulator CckA
VTSRKRAEQALRESEEKFAKAFHASPGAMAIYERGGAGFIEVNDRYVEMFGYTREELIGRTISEMGLWGSEAERDKFAAEFDVHGRVRDLEVVRRRRDGALITCLLSAEPIELSGRPRIFTSLYDITARRQTEQALRDSEERFSKAFRAVPDAVLITDPATGRVVDVNEGCFRVFGYPREECIGRTTTDLQLWTDPADRMRLMSELRAGGGSVRNLEFTGRTRSGSRADVLVSCETIELHGQPHLVTIARDITEWKRAERALRDSEAKFAQSFRASPGAIGITDLETRQYTEVNDSYCRLVGYERGEMIGRTALELGVWANLEERTRFIETFLARGSVDDMEILVRRRDGEVLTCILRAEKVVLSGREHIVSALTDITARRRSETERNALEAQLRQAQKLEALGQLAGGIAHDFNNILTGISAYTDLAVMDADRPADVQAHLQQVRRATDRAADLVRQILTFSRQTAQERKPIRLHAVLREALKLLRSSIPKSIAIVERFDPVAPIVLADPTQVHQVIMNLCTNATHAMRAAGGQLTVTLDSLSVGGRGGATRTDLQPGTYARLTVSDTGHGMDSATLARVFEPFFTTKEPGQGTGLGLSVVHGIIEDHDGVINVRSTPGAGTTFEVCLPEHGHVVVADVEANAELPRGRGQRVLLVDDEAMIVAAGTQLLTLIGYRVTAHTDPRAAWAAFEQAPEEFDAVLSDLTMPHLTGVELARRVLAKRPGMPMLLATGQAMSWTNDSLRALGMRGVIAKPLTVGKLAHALHDLFAERDNEPKSKR